ncbi:hypothetical protein JXA88_16000 [Candidatus Fermentibacteria bacterium]|nr:hypothetical protein [Candidatus Fermentibacteria bacterium]
MTTAETELRLVPQPLETMNSLTLRIADHGIRLIFPDDSLISSARDRYGGFLSNEEPDTVMAVSFPERLQPVVDAGVPWARCATDDIRFGRNDLVAETDSSFGHVAVQMRTLVYTLDALLRIFYSIVLIRRGGLLLHAAAVGIDGRGAVFAGPTESGKSELSHMEFGTHLTDELSPVRPQGHGFSVFGSPFWGLFEKGGYNRGLPLAGLFFLSRGPTRLERLSRALALPRLLRCVLNFSREPEVVEAVMANSARVLARVPHASLVSPPDETLWPLVSGFLVFHRSGSDSASLQEHV